MKRMTTILTFAGLALAAPLLADREVTHQFRTTVPSAGIQKVIVDIPIAELRITTGTGSQISAYGHVSREYDDSDEMREAQKFVDQASVEIEIHGSRAIVKRKFGSDASRRSRNHHTQFHVNVTMPPGVDLDIDQNIGEIEVDGSFGNIDIRQSIGEVTVRTPRKNVRELTAHTTIGEIRADVGDRIVSREGILPGSTHYMNAGGKSTLSVRTRIGEIDIDLVE